MPNIAPVDWLRDLMVLCMFQMMYPEGFTGLFTTRINLFDILHYLELEILTKFNENKI